MPVNSRNFQALFCVCFSFILEGYLTGLYCTRIPVLLSIPNPTAESYASYKHARWATYSFTSINIEIETQSTSFKTNNVGRDWHYACKMKPRCFWRAKEKWVRCGLHQRNRFRLTEGFVGVVERVVINRIQIWLEKLSTSFKYHTFHFWRSV